MNFNWIPSPARLNARGSLSTIILLALLSACAAPKTAQHYEPEQTRMLQQVAFGIIVDVRPVTLNGTQTGQGAAAGAVVGALPGMQAANTTRAAVGGVVGNFLGQGIESALARREGLELLVTLDDGNSVAVTQEADGLSYTAGQRVRVITLNGSARVVHHNAPATPRTTPNSPARLPPQEGLL